MKFFSPFLSTHKTKFNFYWTENPYEISAALQKHKENLCQQGNRSLLLRKYICKNCIVRKFSEIQFFSWSSNIWYKLNICSLAAKFNFWNIFSLHSSLDEFSSWMSQTEMNLEVSLRTGKCKLFNHFSGPVQRDRDAACSQPSSWNTVITPATARLQMSGRTWYFTFQHSYEFVSVLSQPKYHLILL